MKKLYTQFSEFLKSVVGQKFLILLAPFMRLPGETTSSNSRVQYLIDQLHIRSGAPVIGSMFFASALAVVSRTVDRQTNSWNHHLNLDSFSVWVYMTGALSILSYSLVISKYVAPRLLNLLLKKASFPSYSFGFWSTYYGGLLMFFGIFLWGFTLLFVFQISLWLWLFLVIGLGVAVWFLQRQLYFRRQEFIKSLSDLERLHLKTLETMMTLVQLGISVLIWWRWGF
ncbi:MAG: hypothetical protein ACRYGR_08760 [Janthinobacterium lividum]